LTFEKIFGLLVGKTEKSNQIKLNEFWWKMGSLDNEEIPTKSAFSQARAKFKHTAFIELREDTVKDYYEDGNYKKYKGLVLIATDGSKINLPNKEDIKREFGVQKIKVGEKTDEYAMGLASVAYDVLNKMVLDSILVGVNNDERQLAIKHLEKCTLTNICFIYDRGYPSYELCGELTKQEKKFVMRCSRSCFKEVAEVFSESGEIDKVVEIKRKDKSIHLPESIQLRVVKLKLKTGEDEVLITNIFDEEFGIEDFREIYRLRWQEEEFYKIIKERLSLENFSGLSVEGVRQDFESTMFVINIESIFTEEVDEELEKKCERKGNKNGQKVNKNISFNAIKNEVVELFLSDTPIEELSERLEAIFRQSPTSIRDERSYGRKRSASKSVRYRKYSRKACF